MVLDLLPADAERHDSALLSMPEVISLILNARSGNLDVIRLHTGDPSIYSAMSEQMDELDRHGIEYEVVPGVSSFQAAASVLAWELTIPEAAQTIVLTRTPGRTPMPESEELAHYARTGATLCLFLSVHTIEKLALELATYYGENCPVAVVYRASWPNETVVRGTLGDIAEKIKLAGLSKTALVIVRREPPFGVRSRLYDASFSHGYRKGDGA